MARTLGTEEADQVSVSGRRVLIGWTGPAPADMAPLRGQGSAQSLPRELSLDENGALRIRPLRELETLRRDPVKTCNVSIDHPVEGHGDVVPPTKAPALAPLTSLDEHAVEIRIRLARQEVERKLFGFVLFAGGGQGLPIVFRPDSGTVRLGDGEAPFAVNDLAEGEDLELRLRALEGPVRRGRF